MKYYSELTKKVYDTENECKTAESALESKNSERKRAAAHVEETRKRYDAARKEYYDELSDFCKKYGYYHTTLTKEDMDNHFGTDILENLISSFLKV